MNAVFVEIVRLCAGLRASVLILCLHLAVPAIAKDVAGIRLQDMVKVGDSDLVLNGAGARTAYFLKFYVASLYLPRKSHTKDEIVQMRGAKRLQMVMLFDATSKDFNKALIRGMTANSSADELAKLESRMHEFEKVIDTFVSVKKGDVVNMDFVPGTGLLVSVNGHSRSAAITGEDFYAKLLEIFIGQHVADVPLRKQLLGL
jgi:hypothetical protein